MQPRAAQARGGLVRGEQAVGIGRAAFAVDPLGLDRVEPGALHGQLADR